MKAVETARYERKFVPDGLPRSHVEALVRKHPAVFRTAFPPRRVNNVYCDFLDFRDYHDNLDGAHDRTKARVRWYGEVLGRVDAPVLELKIKRGWLGYKRRIALPPFTVDGRIDCRGLRRLLRGADVPAEARVRVLSVHPTLLNTYHRAYFESADRRFRVTIDSDIRFHDPHRSLGRRALQRTARDPIVVELKYDADLDDEASAITSWFPFRLSRNSKYVSGLEHACLS